MKFAPLKALLPLKTVGMSTVDYPKANSSVPKVMHECKAKQGARECDKTEIAMLVTPSHQNSMRTPFVITMMISVSEPKEELRMRKYRRKKIHPEHLWRKEENPR